MEGILTSPRTSNLAAAQVTHLRETVHCTGEWHVVLKVACTEPPLFVTNSGMLQIARSAHARRIHLPWREHIRTHAVVRQGVYAVAAATTTTTAIAIAIITGVATTASRWSNAAERRLAATEAVHKRVATAPSQGGAGYVHKARVMLVRRVHRIG